MSEVARIKPQTRMACPTCSHILRDFSLDEVADGKPQSCPKCGQKVKLPDELVQRAKQTRYLGNNLDITC